MLNVHELKHVNNLRAEILDRLLKQNRRRQCILHCVHGLGLLNGKQICWLNVATKIA